MSGSSQDPPDRKDAIRKILSTGWLADQAAAFQNAVMTEARLVSYDPGQFTHHIGDDAGGFFGVVDGTFGVMGSGPGSGVVLGGIVHRGTWFGHGAMILGRPRTLTFRAMEASVAFTVPVAAYERIARAVPQAPLIIARLSEYNALTIFRAMSDLLIRRSDRRVASVLLRIAEGYAISQPEGPAAFALTQADLAEMANVSRHTVNALLRGFEGRGWLAVSYGRIHVTDLDALRAFVGDHP